MALANVNGTTVIILTRVLTVQALATACVCSGSDQLNGSAGVPECILAPLNNVFGFVGSGYSLCLDWK